MVTVTMVTVGTGSVSDDFPIIDRRLFSVKQAPRQPVAPDLSYEYNGMGCRRRAA